MTTIAAFLDIGIYLLFIFLILVCLLLLVVILMQRPKQEGLGAAFGSALTDQAFGARTTDVLKKATIYLGSFFMAASLVLAVLLNKKYTEEQLDASLVQPEQKVEQKEAGTAEEKKAEQPKSIADMVEEAGKPEAPAQQPAPAQTPKAPETTPGA